MAVRLKKPKATSVYTLKGCSGSLLVAEMKTLDQAWSYLVRPACGSRVLDIKI